MLEEYDRTDSTIDILRDKFDDDMMEITREIIRTIKEISAQSAENAKLYLKEIRREDDYSILFNLYSSILYNCGLLIPVEIMEFFTGNEEIYGNQSAEIEGRLYRAARRYQRTGRAPKEAETIDPLTNKIFGHFWPMIERSINRNILEFLARGIMKRANGSKGGRGKEPA